MPYHVAGSPTLVNPGTSDAAAINATTGLVGGGYVVLFLRNHLGSRLADLRAQIFDADGNSVGSPVTVLDNWVTNFAPAPFSVVGLPNGGFAIASLHENLINSSTEISVQTFNASGVAISGAIPVSVGTAFYGEPKIAVAGNHLIVVWDETGSNYGAYARVFDFNGVPLAQSITVDPATVTTSSATVTYNVFSPVVAGLTNNAFIAVWEDDRGVQGDASSFGIRAQIFNGSGVATGAAFLVNTTTLSSQFIPHVATLIDGNFVVIWGDASSGTEVLRGQLIDVAGTRVGVEFLIGDTHYLSPQNRFDAFTALSALPTGGFVVSWDDRSTGLIHLSEFNNSGLATGTTIISDPNRSYTSIASLANGGYEVNQGGFDSIYNERLVHTIVANDFNGDGRSDILWRNADGSLGNWLGNASGTFAVNGAVPLMNVPNEWHITATGDFNGDGRSDILWRNDSGALGDWLGTATGDFTVNPQLVNVPTEWKVAGAGDFNGDGRSDILWRNDNGLVGDWLGTASGNFSINSGSLVAVPTAWKIAGVGDFNGDGRSDILWRNDDGTIGNWLGNASGNFDINNASVAGVPNEWKIAGVGDFNGDGRSDILWRNANGALGDWLGTASGGYAVNPTLTQVPNEWHVSATGDYNGDGRDDILWRNDNGALGDWLGTASGNFTINGGLYQVPTSWHVQPEMLV